MATSQEGGAVEQLNNMSGGERTKTTQLSVGGGGEGTAADDGYYSLRGSHGLYWTLGSGGGGGTAELSANGAERRTATRFAIELLPNNRMLIKAAANGLYLKGEQNGSIAASALDSASATQWEF
jgi:hypothetical protein